MTRRNHRLLHFLIKILQFPFGCIHGKKLLDKGLFMNHRHTLLKGRTFVDVKNTCGYLLTPFQGSAKCFNPICGIIVILEGVNMLLVPVESVEFVEGDAILQDVYQGKSIVL